MIEQLHHQMEIIAAVYNFYPTHINMRFNSKNSTQTINLAGGHAFTMNPKQELVHAVLTTMLDEKYYESSEERMNRLRMLIKANKPGFVANLAVIARTEFNLRTVSHILLAELALQNKGYSAWKAYEKAIIRPDDILEIVSYIGIKNLPKQTKKGIKRALYKFSRYQLAKYRGETRNIKMVDVFNMVHPNPEYANEEQKETWRDLINGNLKSFDTWETEISAAGNDIHKKREIWSRLISENKIGYMALLRNINNIVEVNVDDEIIDIVAKRLSDVEQVRKSKQLPFRFYTAYENVVNAPIKLRDAIVDAMDISIGNLENITGKTLIALDSSGSMSGRPLEIGSIFASAMLKRSEDVNFILYDTKVKEIALSRRSTIIDMVKIIKGTEMGGGTNTELVFQYALNNPVYDNIIIISDNESWYGNRVQDGYNNYKKVATKNPKIFAIDIQGYGTTDISSPDVKHLVGWSDRLLDFINTNSEDLVSYIENYEL